MIYDTDGLTLEESIERLHNLNQLNQDKDLQEQLGPEWVRKNKVPFARVGIFNPYTLKDWTNTLERMFHGIAPNLNKDYWFLDRWLDHPVRLMRTRGKLVRDGRIKWRFTNSNSQLYLTPHAAGRFRERSGYFINPDIQCWNIPHITKGVDLDAEGKTITSQMLPTLDGAWLGYNVVGLGNGDEQYSYTRKHGCKLKELNTKTHYTHFYALTYITEGMMSDLQIDACRAYDAGDYDRFDELNRKNSVDNPSTIF